MTLSRSLFRRSSSRKPVASVQWLHTAKEANAAEVTNHVAMRHAPYSTMSVRERLLPSPTRLTNCKPVSTNRKAPREVEPGSHPRTAGVGRHTHRNPRASPPGGGSGQYHWRSAIPSIVEQTIASCRSPGDGLKPPDPLRNHDQSEARQIQCDYRQMNRDRTTEKASKTHCRAT